MTCFFCKGDMIDGLTTYTLDSGNCVIVIRNVPCIECDQCGEIVYIGTVVKQIEKIIDNMQQTVVMSVAIVNYSDKVVA